jgi:hypothetical protein
MDDNGNALVVWTQYDGNRYNLWYRRYSRGADAWETPGMLEGDVANESGRVVMDASGRALAIWRANAPAPLEEQYLRGAMYDLGWRSIFPIATAPFGVGGAEAAATRGGQAVVVWSSFTSVSPLQSDVLAVRCALTATGCAPPTPLENDSAGGWDFDPQVAINSTGTAVAVWLRYDALLGTNRLRASRMLAGAWDAAPTFVSGSLFSVNGSPSVGVDESGNALAVWPQNLGSGPGATVSPFASRFEGSSGWSLPQALESQSRMEDIYPARRPRVAFWLTGEAMAVWETGSGVISSASYSGGSWAPMRDVGAGASGVSREPQIVFDSIGRPVSVFVQNSGPNSMPSVLSSRFE